VTVDVHAIPIQGRFILYRPLLSLAFVGNRAMADLTLDAVRQAEEAGNGQGPGPGPFPGDAGGTSAEALRFLQEIGFLKPDPALPPEPRPGFRPTTAVLLLTSRCNLRCVYCYAEGGGRAVQDLEPALAHAAIDEVARHAAESGQKQFDLNFHGGGEPVSAWDVMQEATEYARGKEVRCRTSVVSNGIWSARQREWILANVDSASISFDGRPETQDRQRPSAAMKGSSRAVMRTLRALDKAKFPYGIRMTATPPFRGQLPEDVRFICEETQCRAMQVEPAFNTLRGEHRGPDWEQSAAFAEAFLDAFEIASRAGRQLVYSGARPWLRTATFCTAPHGALIVAPGGALVACYEITDELHPLAAISQVGCVAEGRVQVDARRREALLAHLEGRRRACRDCIGYWHCAGDCYTRGIAATAAGPVGANPRCAMNRRITAGILLWYIMNGDGVWRGQGWHPQGAQLMRTF
jgi:uncharacterized protein